jgi:hypothetical protein
MEDRSMAAGFPGVAAVVGCIALRGLALLVRDPPTVHSAKARDALAGAYLKQHYFWLIVVPVLGISVATFGVIGSLVPLLSDRGDAPAPRDHLALAP